MRRMRWITYLWPGLPQLRTDGSWSGLVLALAAATLLDLVVLASFGWTELISQNLRITSWAALGVFWILASGWSIKTVRRQAEVADPQPDEDQFAEAVDYYLKGDYYQTEHVLERLLRNNLRDVDARLMLATLMRHTGRLDEAAGQLDTLSRFDGADKWALEIQKERERLNERPARDAIAA